MAVVAINNIDRQQQHGKHQTQQQQQKSTTTTTTKTNSFSSPYMTDLPTTTTMTIMFSGPSGLGVGIGGQDYNNNKSNGGGAAGMKKHRFFGWMPREFSVPAGFHTFFFTTKL